MSTINVNTKKQKWKYNKIKFFSEQHNNDLIDNQFRMLNSVLNYEKWWITLDCIIVIDHETPYILTDPSDIKRIAINHFQSSAGIPPVNITIPVTWFDEFNPKDYINAVVYTDLMNNIAELEFSQIISNLLTNKASGPSTVSYESVKHAY